MFKFLFKKKEKRKKHLYKIVYRNGWGIYDNRGTLLVPGNSPAEAMEDFYKKIGAGVKDILEFTEINYGSDVKKEVSDGV